MQQRFRPKNLWDRQTDRRQTDALRFPLNVASVIIHHDTNATRDAFIFIVVGLYLLFRHVPPGLPSRTFACTVSSELIRFRFYFFLNFFVSVPCARSWPFCQLLSARTISYRVSYILCRFTCSLIYYALAFNTGELHGDIYVNTFIAGAVEMPAYVLSMLLLDWRPVGRKWTGCSSLIVTAIFSFLCIPTLMFGQRILKYLQL